MTSYAHLEPCEACGKRGPCPHYPASVHGFPARVALAAQCIRTGDGTGSRGFDDCFENYDGDAVMLSLLRMARTDEALRRGIDREWSSPRSKAANAALLDRFGYMSDDRIAEYAAHRRQRERQRCDAEYTQMALI